MGARPRLHRPHLHQIVPPHPSQPLSLQHPQDTSNGGAVAQSGVRTMRLFRSAPVRLPAGDLRGVAWRACDGAGLHGKRGRRKSPPFHMALHRQAECAPPKGAAGPQTTVDK